MKDHPRRVRGDNAPVIHRPLAPSTQRWLLALALAALLGAQGLAWVHAVLHPGAGTVHTHAVSAVDTPTADVLKPHDGQAHGHVHAASWVQGLVAGHDDGSSLCQWFDALCVAGAPGDAPALLLHDRPDMAQALGRPTLLGSSWAWQRPPARAPPFSA